MDGIVGCTTTRGAFPANESRITQTSDIYIVFFKIPFAPAFTCLFADPINGRWFHNSVLWRVYAWRCGSKNSDRTRPVDLTDTFFFCKIEHIKKTFHVEFPCKHWILLACSR